ncbi:Colicin I receptor precursor [Brevundimonas sp. SH203]|uniref:TonB-dependent receptor domain-containing protein n=1 Tax=Brevundimonas sp. SH203 TaxID=345167 RepID=UPI0009D16E36|nr:TonB-dependent receptor [Brevundimonas sp. SH203]GAW40958.1 Colicin I receptor precursor [Brevundimonas sp. SH203]
MRNASLNAKLLATTALVFFSLSAAHAASAQTRAPKAEAEAESAAQVDDVVVTGTLLRGVAPTGTNVVSLAREDVIATGAASSNDLLARIPQISNAFNSAPQPGGTIALPINRPNIRNLGASGGSTTLVLLNGHRMVGAGILQTSPDPSVIPPAVLERVEVIPDGGSSIYGSDAIGGVVNFITRKAFDGVEAAGRYGFADGYDQFDLNLTAGRTWRGGSAIVAYTYAEHSNIAGADRDYFIQDLRARGGSDFRSKACSPGTITTPNPFSPLLPGVDYALPGRTPGTNLCDEAKAIDLYPEETRHSLFATVSHDLNERLAFDVTAYYAQRETGRRGISAAEGTGIRGGGLIAITNPYFRPIGTELGHNVTFNYADAWGAAAPKNTSRFTSAGVTPSLTYQINDDWRLKGALNWGRSTNLVRTWQINTAAEAAALAGTTTATALNPYDVGATNADVLRKIIDFQSYGHSTQEIREARAVADGGLFALPAGEVKLAVGVEYHEETIKAQQGTGAPSALNLASSSAKRDVTSVFAEILAPVFDSPAYGALDLSASVRYDSYSDVGDTTNPKIGFNYRPTASLTVRGNWGTSFHAPSLSDMGDGVDTRVQVINASPWLPAGAPFTDLFRPTLILAGGNANLKPETADTWSLGVDWRPQGALEGVKASLTYFNVAFEDAIGLAPFLRGAPFYADPAYAPYYVLNPTLAQATARTAGLAVDGAPSIASLYAGFLTPAVLIDARRNNLGVLDVDGLDFNFEYARPASFGLWHVGLAGTYNLNRESRAIAGAPKTNEFDNGASRYSLVGSAGVVAGPVMGELTVNHSASADMANGVGQTRIGSFTTVNLFAAYDLNLGGAFSDTSVTLNVDNLFDEEPPFYNAAGGTANGSTLGRLVSIGVRKAF